MVKKHRAVKKSVKKVKSSAPKKVQSSKVQSSAVSKVIHGLESCIMQDKAKLAKAYPKSLADVGKSLKQAVQELTKAKKAKSAKSSKSGKKAKPANFSSLEKAVANLKGEKSALQAGHKKFVAMHKALQTFEKGWAKKAKAASRKGSKRKSAKKSSKKHGIFSNLMHSAGM